MKNYWTSKNKFAVATLIVTIAFAGVFASCKGKGETKDEAKVQYECPMHPDQVSDKPGTCPICKMDLVEKKDEKKEEHQH